MLNPCGLEYLDVESNSGDSSSIELVAEPTEVAWIAVYHGHVMAFFRELCGKLSAKAPTTNDNNIHDKHLLANP
jgi:phage terminase large subunit GpA-like protein